MNRIELSKCKCETCESNRVGHCMIANAIMRVNKKTANCESICELRPKKTQFLDFFVKSRKGPKNSGLKKTKINAQFSVGVASMRFPPPYVTPANLSISGENR